jgi:hypothetical protein
MPRVVPSFDSANVRWTRGPFVVGEAAPMIERAAGTILGTIAGISGLCPRGST